MINIGEQVLCIRSFRSKYPDSNIGLPDLCPEKGETYTVAGIVQRTDVLRFTGLVFDGLPCPAYRDSGGIKQGDEIGWWSKNFTNLDGSPVDPWTDEQKAEMEEITQRAQEQHKWQCAGEIESLRRP